MISYLDKEFILDKPEIPQEVANYIEECKRNHLSVYAAMEQLEIGHPVFNFLFSPLASYDNNLYQTIFSIAFTVGYKVKKTNRGDRRC